MSDYQKPLILVCNDDGIFSNGIKALADVADEFGDVFIVAPEKEQSAVGHSVTMHVPLRANKCKINNRFNGIAIDGTPADCIKLAHHQLMDRKPDLVVSGINHGSNAGINILYSGTVSAAIEGAILGYPSIAFSIVSEDMSIKLDDAKAICRQIIALVLRAKLPPKTILNVNIPDSKIRGIKITKQGDSKFINEYVHRIDPRKRNYFWLTGDLQVYDEAEDVDLVALRNNFVSITPVSYDLTAQNYLDKLEKIFNQSDG